MRNLRRRIHRLEQQLCPSGDGLVTLEELLRSLWRDDRDAFLGATESLNCRYLTRHFELEDAERDRRGMRGTGALRNGIH